MSCRIVIHSGAYQSDREKFHTGNFMEYVGIYNRCSTEEECQVNALEIQAEESAELVKRMENWCLVEQYIESQSGTSSKNRTKYQKMLKDIEKGRFTIIVIKSIDRLARNTKDWYFFLDCITKNQVKLYLYLEQKFYSPKDSLITGIKAILAEEFSRELSQKIKNAHRRRQEKCSGYNITKEMFGWNKIETNVYEINEEEAKAYRYAFELAKQGYGYRRISNAMYEMGVRSRQGKKISEVQWRKMLRTKRAHGTVVLHTAEYDFEAKKKIPIPEDKQIVLENALPPIVTKEYQDEILDILDKRAEKCKEEKSKVQNRGKYAFSGKIDCGICQRAYYRCERKRKTDTKIQWKCSSYISSGTKTEGKSCGCNNLKLEENQLYDLVWKAYRHGNNEEITQKEYWLWEMKKILDKLWNQQENLSEKKRLHQKLEKLEFEKTRLLEKLLEDIISDDDYKAYEKKLSLEINQIKNQLIDIKGEESEYINYEARTKSILEKVQNSDMIEKAQKMACVKYVKKIVVQKDGNLAIWFGDREQPVHLFYEHL